LNKFGCAQTFDKTDFRRLTCMVSIKFCLAKCVMEKLGCKQGSARERGYWGCELAGDRVLENWDAPAVSAVLSDVLSQLRSLPR
jgi:hypothetical protein